PLRIRKGQSRPLWPHEGTSLTDLIERAEHEISGTDAEPAIQFADLGISGVLGKAVAAAGMSAPKPIQVLSLPPLLEGRDILGIAQTGSGKTAAFALPILAKIAGLGDQRRAKSARALILAPTRELAV